MAELTVKLLQALSDSENDAKSSRYLVPEIAQHGKSKFIFFLRAQ
jgi:hypothetical protein